MFMLEKKSVAEAESLGAKPPLMWMVHAFSFARGGPEAPAKTLVKVLVLTLHERTGDALPAKYGTDSIVRAWYGVPGNEWTENLGWDVTAEVKEILQSGETVLAANVFFGDPALFVPKVLVVQVEDEVDGHIPMERGTVISASRFRSKNPYGLVPIADTAGCMCAGPHTCYAEATSGGSGGFMWNMPSNIFVINHYVEMLSHNVGRCDKGGRKEDCDIPDTSAMWLRTWLQEVAAEGKITEDGAQRIEVGDDSAQVAEVLGDDVEKASDETPKAKQDGLTHAVGIADVLAKML